MKTAMILAAGRGERMRPITDNIPKPLLEIKGKSLIEHHLRNLMRANVERVVINHCWLGDKLVSHVNTIKGLEMEILFSEEHRALETAGGIVNAMSFLAKNEEDTFWTVNGDIYCDFEFSSLPIELGHNVAHLVMVHNPEHNPDGDFSLASGQLGVETNNRLTYSGIAIYKKAFFAGVEARVRPLAPLFRGYISQNQLGGQLHEGSWSDVGTPERLTLLNASDHSL